MWRAKAIATLCCFFGIVAASHACDAPGSVCAKADLASFPLIRAGRPAAVYVDTLADPAVHHVADDFAADLERVSGQAAGRVENLAQASGDLVVIGVPGRSEAIDALVRAGKLDVTPILGRWEAFERIVVEHPFPKVRRALIIVGADRRGAVFGTYDLSEKIGVSPWYWFADVPVAHQSNVFITAGSYSDAPKVKYRGFFINDEAPSFSTWATRHFGGFNSRMYEHVFELLLRLKGNYLWPSMWAPRAFNDDDPQNKILADAMGVVMGTSHQEPMTRAEVEWHRNTDQGVTGGQWDYALNASNLRAFWRGGIERMMSKGNGEPYESLVTIGMRGDGDMAMPEANATQLMETIVADQRQIIADVTGKAAAQTPQVWALYKEVQDYYDHGMQVPDDVTLLFSDDNWGQIRRLPTANLGRSGGYGIYYHFDYVGAPRNYKWVDTVQIEKSWQQMDLAYARGAKALWIVNVGDIKPLEYPLSFFLSQAWNPERMTLEALERYPTQWAGSVFGAAKARAIGDLLTRYSKFTARRKPELVDADSFHLGEGIGARLDGGEFGAMVAEWQALEHDMLNTKATLTAKQLPAYLQLVEYPISALSNLYQLYYAVAWNRRLAASGDPRANSFVDQATDRFKRDQALAAAYQQVNGGEWDGMMAQTHIGYTSWQEPKIQVMPAVQRAESNAEAQPIVFAAYHSPYGPASDAVAIEAPQYTRALSGKGLQWRAVPNLGHTLGAVTTFPQGQSATTEQDAVRLEYDVKICQAGDLTVQLVLVPTLDTTGQGALRIGVSIDEGPMQTLTDQLLPAPGAAPSQEQRDWNRAVEDNARRLQTVFANTSAGKHTVKIWRLDDDVVLQKLVMSTGPIPATYN